MKHRKGTPLVRTKSKTDWEQNATAAVFLSPAVITIGVFTLYPIVSAGYTSLTTWNGFSPNKTFVGLDNYIRLAGDPEFHNSLLITLIYAIGVCLLSLVSGLSIALLLDSPLHGRGLYRTIYFLPVVTSSVAAAIVWKYMLDDAGLVNTLLSTIGVKGIDWLQNRWIALGALIQIGRAHV